MMFLGDRVCSTPWVKGGETGLGDPPESNHEQGYLFTGYSRNFQSELNRNRSEGFGHDTALDNHHPPPINRQRPTANGQPPTTDRQPPPGHTHQPLRLRATGAPGGLRRRRGARAGRGPTHRGGGRGRGRRWCCGRPRPPVRPAGRHRRRGWRGGGAAGAAQPLISAPGTWAKGQLQGLGGLSCPTQPTQAGGTQLWVSFFFKKNTQDPLSQTPTLRGGGVPADPPTLTPWVQSLKKNLWLGLQGKERRRRPPIQEPFDLWCTARQCKKQQQLF